MFGMVHSTTQNKFILKLSVCAVDINGIHTKRKEFCGIGVRYLP
jgi:hypothetical protein